MATAGLCGLTKVKALQQQSKISQSHSCWISIRVIEFLVSSVFLIFLEGEQQRDGNLINFRHLYLTGPTPQGRCALAERKE